jgi:16S rRNA (cytosine967-C5)-methyltransferase
MNTTSLAGHIVELHAAVLGSRHPADSVAREFLRARRYLGSRDRRFITEALYDMLRNHRLLVERVNAASQSLSGKLPVSSLTLYAAYALAIESRLPDALLADIAPLWAAFLRESDCRSSLNAIARADPLADPAMTTELRLAISFSFPEFILREWLGRYEEEETRVMCAALNRAAPTTLRVNTLRTSVDECLKMLADEGVACRRTAFSPHGIVLEKRVNVQSLAPFRRGCFEMQDEGSQLIGFLVAPPSGGLVIDACAGGGGKTLHLAALMGNRGKLIAIEVSDSRLGNIRERIVRAGAGIVSVYHAQRDPIDALAGSADAVLVDAPCTGVGTFRRNPGAKLTITESDVRTLAATQRSVLKRYADLVRPGGRLVYSTCSLLRMENEDVVSNFLAARPEFSVIPAREILEHQGVMVEGTGEFLSLFPHRHGTDGFFAAVLGRSR